MILCVPSYTLAQLPEPPLPVDPTPISQLLSQADKAILAESNNPKKVVEAYVKISDSHLLAAFNAIKGNNYAAAERELDIYNKAIAEAGKLSFALQDGKRTRRRRSSRVCTGRSRRSNRSNTCSQPSESNLRKPLSNRRRRFVCAR